jgi:hypothetical protein
MVPVKNMPRKEQIIDHPELGVEMVIIHRRAKGLLPV